MTGAIGGLRFHLDEQTADASQQGKETACFLVTSSARISPLVEIEYCIDQYI